MQIWVESDFDYIHEVTKSKLPFAYFFKNSSLLGKPGLAIISKYVPLIVHFERFITNGSPFRFWHGDWFTGKGTQLKMIHGSKDLTIYLLFHNAIKKALVMF